MPVGEFIITTLLFIINNNWLVMLDFLCCYFFISAFKNVCEKIAENEEKNE